MKLAARAGRIVPSPTLAIAATAKAMAARGIDVIDFAAGEPDFDTPEAAKAEAQAAIRAGFTKYTASSGIEELRVVIQDKFKRDQGLEYETSQILVSCGAKHSLYNLAEALFEAGDEVIIPAPYWVSYRDQVLLNDATPVILPTDEADGYAVTRPALEARVTPRTKAIILNSPSNPTGAIYDRATLERVAQVAVERDLVLISDEIYEKIVYDGHRPLSVATLGADVAARTVIVNGVSKAYAMTGWRIGYAAGPKELIAAMNKMQSQSTTHTSSISQAAAVAALNGPLDFLAEWVAAFKERRDLVVGMLDQAEGLSCTTPEGAFYVYPSCAGLIGKRTPDGKTIETDGDFVTYLLESEGVAAVQGEAFGLSPHLRISYATSTDLLRDACGRIQKACAALS